MGERWTLLIVRNLLLGPLRYSDLLRGLPGITTNLLAKRLREMEGHGLVERIRFRSAESGHAYRLTPLGWALEPAIHALGSWGWHWMGQPGPGDHLDVEWLFVALRWRYRGGLSRVAELLVGEVPYRFILAGDRVEIGRGSPPDPELRVRGEARTFARLFLEGWPAEGSPAGIEVEGSELRFRELVEAFERGDGAQRR